MADTATEERGSSVRSFFDSIDVWLQNASYKISNNILWKSLILIFWIYLLLARPIQFFLIPARFDTALNFIFLVGFGFFLMDLVFHWYLDPSYYPKIRFTCKDERSQVPFLPCIYFGSFDFWFDLGTTVCFLFEVSFIFPRRFDQSTIMIPLNPFGFPNARAFADAIKDDNWYSKFSFILLIIKTQMVVRIIPPQMVVDWAAKINLLGLFKRLKPSYYSKKLKLRQRKIKEQNAKRHMKTDGGGLLVATMAARRMIKQKEKKIKERGRFVYGVYLLKARTLDVLRFLHILPKTNIELNRHIAATRIQRAWRNRILFGNEDMFSEGDEGSQAWASNRGDGISSSMDLGLSSRRSRVDDRDSGSNPRDSGSNPRNSKETGVGNSVNTTPHKLKRRRQKRKAPSQVGTAMAELTGNLVTGFIMLNLIFALRFTYIEYDTTEASTMVVLHGQTTTGNMEFAEKAVNVARRSTIPKLYSYTTNSSKNDFFINFTWPDESFERLRKYEIRSITVTDRYGQSTGLFNIANEVDRRATMELFLLAFILLAWFFGVAAFGSPIHALVIVPIERAVKLLGMMFMDPLGYQNTLQYKNFLTEADQIEKNNGQWTKEVLKGMETEFLMSTIVRIGSLMKVGFGPAGVKIIRNNLTKKNFEDTGTLLLNSQGSMVSCIFLFCDIRSFTDVTECLQEEVFSFTNQIASVVHSICSSYGGSANKNIGDAFLISWRLDDRFRLPSRSLKGKVKSYQADKALLSVVKICIALHHNDHYVEMLSEHAKATLLNKLKDRPGPTVQIGFGLHAGKAVEGAIGSQRKIDATYVSMAVEMAETLESSTEKYKVPMLMSDCFHKLLQPRRRQRCRKIDQVMFQNESVDGLVAEDVDSKGKVIEFFTYDVDIDALWNDNESSDDGSEGSSGSDLIPMQIRKTDSLMASRSTPNEKLLTSTRSRGITDSVRSRGGDITAAIAAGAAAAAKALGTAQTIRIAEPLREEQLEEGASELVLPTGRAFYSENIWQHPDIRRIRRRYTTNMFDMFNLGLQKYYSGEWDEARINFEGVLDIFEDGPSMYFLEQMKKHDYTSPPGFQPYGILD